MKVSAEDVKKVAFLARLELNEDEVETMSEQLSSILDWVEQINELDTEDVAPTDHILDIANVYREDKTKPSIPVSKIEENAPNFENGFFIVPRII